MRFIHTADWHLGRIMHGTHLTEDQAYVLDQLIMLARDLKPDALIISGDVYDRPVPPAEAVELLDDFLSRLVLDLGVALVAIGGNHDSPGRLGFASRVLAGRRVHLFGSVSDLPHEVTLEDASGPVHFYAIPYAEPSVVRERLGCDTARDHETATRALTDAVRAVHPPDKRSVLIAHAYVVGSSPSESERPLSVGGADQVQATCFEGFNYVALGHLHAAQSAGAAGIRYAGSILKYSFSEVKHVKSVSVVEMDSAGVCRVESIPLKPRRDVRIKEGYLKEIVKEPCENENREDYIMVRLLDTEPLLDVMGRLREVYPNVLHVERPYLEAQGSWSEQRPDHRKLNDKDLFAAFFSQVMQEDLKPEEAAAYETIVDDLRREEREAAS